MHWTEIYGYDIDWGSVPAWVGSILTSGSLLLGFYILLRDRRKDERAQAAQVTGWVVGGFEYHHEHSHKHTIFKSPFTVFVKNGSTQNIFEVHAIIDCLITPEIGEKLRRQGLTDVVELPQLTRWPMAIAFRNSETDDPPTLEPNAQAFVTPDQTMLSAPVEYYETYIDFTDANAVTWRKNVETGALERDLYYPETFNPGSAGRDIGGSSARFRNITWSGTTILLFEGSILNSDLGRLSVGYMA